MLCNEIQPFLKSLNLSYNKNLMIRNKANTCTFGYFIGNNEAVFVSKWTICKTYYDKYYITTTASLIKLKSAEKIKEHLTYLTKSYNELEREMALRIKQDKIKQMKKNIEDYFKYNP
jgi:hypothetical protein